MAAEAQKHLFPCGDQMRSVCSRREGPSPVVSSHISRCPHVICYGTKLAPDQRLLELNPSCHIACALPCVWLGAEEEAAAQMFRPDHSEPAAYMHSRQTQRGHLPPTQPRERALPRRRMQESCVCVVNAVA